MDKYYCGCACKQVVDRQVKIDQLMRMKNKMRVYLACLSEKCKLVSSGDIPAELRVLSPTPAAPPR